MGRNSAVRVQLAEAIFKETTDEFTVKVATTLDEACELLEAGFAEGTLEIMGIADGTLFNAGFQDDFSMKLTLDANATRGTYTITVTAEGRDA